MGGEPHGVRPDSTPLSPAARAEADRLIAVLAAGEPRTGHFVPAAAWLDQLKKQGFAGFQTLHFVNIAPAAPGAALELPPADVEYYGARPQSPRPCATKTPATSCGPSPCGSLIHLAGRRPPAAPLRQSAGSALPARRHGGNTFPLRWPADPAANLHILWTTPSPASTPSWRRARTGGCSIPEAARELARRLPPETQPARLERRYKLESHRRSPGGLASPNSALAAYLGTAAVRRRLARATTADALEGAPAHSRGPALQLRRKPPVGQTLVCRRFQWPSNGADYAPRSRVRQSPDRVRGQGGDRKS